MSGLAEVASIMLFGLLGVGSLSFAFENRGCLLLPGHLTSAYFEYITLP